MGFIGQKTMQEGNSRENSQENSEDDTRKINFTKGKVTISEKRYIKGRGGPFLRLLYENEDGYVDYYLPTPMRTRKEIVVGRGFIEAHPRGKGFGTVMVDKLSQCLHALARETKRRVIHRPVIASPLSQRLFSEKRGYFNVKHGKGTILEKIIKPSDGGTVTITEEERKAVTWMKTKRKKTIYENQSDADREEPLGIGAMVLHPVLRLR